MEFEVKDMSCGHCVGTVTQAIKEAEAKAGAPVKLTGFVRYQLGEEM